MLRIRVEGREHVVDGKTVLGRADDVDIQVAEPRVSRHHLRLEPADGTWTVHDLDSANGTFLNGLRIGSLDLVGPLRLHLGAQVDGLEVELEPLSTDTSWSPNIPALAEAPAPDRVAALHIRFDGQLFIYRQAEPLIVGREADCFLRTDDARVSRHHARIEWDGRQWTITDLGSRNGTFSGGVRLSSLAVERPVSLLLGDAQTGVPLELTAEGF